MNIAHYSNSLLIPLPLLFLYVPGNPGVMRIETTIPNQDKWVKTLVDMYLKEIIKVKFQ